MPPRTISVEIPKPSGRPKRRQNSSKATFHLDEQSLVWVSSDARSDPFAWWPAKVIRAPTNSSNIVIERFGAEEPRTQMLLPTSKTVLPFRSNLRTLRQQGERMGGEKGARFESAVEEALKAEMEEDDGLPSVELLDVEVRNTPTKRGINKRKGRKSKEPKTKRPKSSGSEGDDYDDDPFTVVSPKAPQPRTSSSDDDEENSKDIMLQIPGEEILALWPENKKYYPALVMDFVAPDRYRVKYFDGKKKILTRDKFFAFCDKSFTTCEIGEIALSETDFDHPELRNDVLALRPQLIDVLTGKDTDDWRLREFQKGGRHRRKPFQYVAQGPFNTSQFHFIWHVLERIFLLETERQNVDGDVLMGAEPVSLNGETDMDASAPEFGDYFTALSARDRQVIVSNVLLPEVIVRLVMRRSGVSREEAEQNVMEERTTDSEFSEALITRVYGMRRALLNGQSLLADQREFLTRCEV